MITIKISGNVISRMPEYCDECFYYAVNPHPYKGWTEKCELCSQCMDDDQEDAWIYDGNSRPKNCPLIEIPDELLKADEQKGR